MEKNNDEVVDLCRIESTKNFNYDNCIVIKREADESFSDTSLLENETTKEISEDENSDMGNVSLDLKEAFVLMVGILNRVERYFNQKNKRKQEEKTLIEDMQYIKKALINSDKNFGYDTFTDENGTVYIRNYKCSENTEPEGTPTLENKSVQTVETHLNLDQVNSPTDELEKEYVDMEITGVTKSITKSKKKISNEKSIVKMDKSPKSMKGQKRKISSPENIKQVKKNIKLAKITLVNELVEKATVISKSTGEDYDRVLYNLKKEAGLDPRLPRKHRPTNKSAIPKADKTKSNLTATQKQASHKNDINQRKGNAKSLDGEIKANTNIGSNKQDLSIPQDSMTRSAGKRKLYSQEMWLAELAKTIMEPT